MLSNTYSVRLFGFRLPDKTCRERPFIYVGTAPLTELIFYLYSVQDFRGSPLSWLTFQRWAIDISV